MFNLLVIMNLRRKVFSWDEIKMLFDVLLGEVIKKELCWVAEVIFKAIYSLALEKGSMRVLRQTSCH